jgi:dipeptidase D
MLKEISNLSPKNLWENFYQLSQIPRISKHEQAVSIFIQKFAKDLKLEVKADELNNVLIRKPAVPGCENYPTVILQGHLDMVGQKQDDVIHDFLKDPIKVVIDGDWVRAEGTTLGADNGIGVAAAMAVLQAHDIKHGPIEALFTVDEEETCSGAVAIKPDLLKGRVLLNLDNEADDEAFIGCAGRQNTRVKFKYTKTEAPNNVTSFILEVKGLRGGHSGADIHLGRGNANQIIGSILFEVSEKIKWRLGSISGGEALTVIPTRSSAVVIVSRENENEFKRLVETHINRTKAELSITEPDLAITLSSAALPKFLLDETSQDNILKFIYTCPNGVFNMSFEVPGVVSTSNNISLINLTDDIIEIVTIQRSFVESCQYRIGNIIDKIGKMTGAEVSKMDMLPGWKPEPNSKLVKYVNKKFREMHNCDLKLVAGHVLVECGILKKSYPDMEMVSIGPNTENAHSFRERVNILSVAKFWKFLVSLLEGVKDI